MSRNTLFLILIFSFVIWSCQKDDTSPSPENGTLLFVYDLIEESPISNGERFPDPISGFESTGWGVYEDIIFPGTEIQWNIQHEDLNDDRVLALGIIGGDAYNNAFFTNTIAIGWEELEWPFQQLDRMVYRVDFYVDHDFNCENPDLSTLEGLEFTFQHLKTPYSYGFGLQFSKGGEWRFWDDTKDENGKAIGWVSFANKIFGCLASERWHSLEISGRRINHNIQYEYFNINGEQYDISSAMTEPVNSPSGWVENFLQVGVQLNGNRALDSSHGHGVDPVGIKVNNIQLIGYLLQ